MKKILAMLLSLLMILSLVACGQKQEVVINEPVIEDEEPVVEYLKGTARVSGVKVFWKEVDRGTKLTVIGEEDDYYRAQIEDTQFLVDKRFIRLSTETMPQEKTRYCKGIHDLYDSAYLNGAELVRMALNDSVTVLDEYNGVSYVRFGDISGYILSSYLSDSKYVYTPKPEVPQTEQYSSGGGGGSWSGGGSSGGGSGGGDTGGGSGGGDTGGDTGGSGEPQDGGEIKLAMTYPLRGKSLAEIVGKWFISVAKADEGKSATVFSDHVEFFLNMTSQGEELQVIEAGDDFARVFVNGQEGIIPRWAVIMDNDKAFDEWIGYAVSGAKLFTNADFTGDVTTLKMNDSVQVLYQIDEDTYLVKVGSEIGYMLVANIKTEKIVYIPTPKAKVEETPNYSDSSSSGGGWSGGSGGGDTGGGSGSGDTGGDTGGDSSGDSDWTEPVL